MPFEIEVAVSANQELKALRKFDRQRIADEIDKQLRAEPTKPTRNRKCLVNVRPGFNHLPPIWELRVGEFRVFYDVDEQRGVVYIRAVRRKAPEQTTEEVVQ